MNSLAGMTALVVEDEPIVAMLAEDLLFDMGFGNVVVSGSVKRALEALRDHRVDLAVLDINLNGEKSFPVADYLSERNIPFLFASGYTDHVTPFPHAVLINKPYGLDQLTAAVEKTWAG